MFAINTEWWQGVLLNGNCWSYIELTETTDGK